MVKIIGPFSQILTMTLLPSKGPIGDDKLRILNNLYIAVENGIIKEIDTYITLKHKYTKAIVENLTTAYVLLPGFVDCHTHAIFGGSRAMDFAERNAGKSYLEIAEKGGGIWSTVKNTRLTDDESLIQKTESILQKWLLNGITTVEIKSGYGLSVAQEIRILNLIKKIKSPVSIISTCLAAHIKPKDFDGSPSQYLDLLCRDLLPNIQDLTNRVDIFIEKSAFSIEESKKYLAFAKSMGYGITVHADQFTAGSSIVAVNLGALSADHLEASTSIEIDILANSDTVAVALPGASIGLGEPFTPARKLLDAGACLAIASDYNPGSAPMGDLLTQASILTTYQKLSTAEVFAGLTYRAAKALRLTTIGKIEVGFQADFQAYSTDDYREILYHQGKLKPSMVWKKGENI